MIDIPFEQAAERPAGSPFMLRQRRFAAASLSPTETLPDDRDLRRYALWPVGLLIALLSFAVVCAFIPGAFVLLINSEQGVVENLTVIIALVGCWYACRLVLAAPPSPGQWIKIWFGLFALGQFLLAGEEISWGQHWFFWQTPETFAFNMQQETNLHNYSKYTERMPKDALTAGIYAAGIVYPLWILFRGPLPLIRRAPLSPIWPSAALWASSVIAFGIYLAERSVAWQGGYDWNPVLFHSLREGFEVFLVLFITLYMYETLRRYRRMAPKR